MNTRRLHIPPNLREGLECLLAMDASKHSELRTALSSTKSRMLSSRLAERVAKHLQMDIGDASVILQTLTALYVINEAAEMDADGFAASLREAIEKDIGNDDPRLTTFQETISELFRAGSALQVAAKASAVMAECAQIYGDARIITDLRPIFARDATRVDALAVVHTLRIGVHRNGDWHPLYISMDGADLHQLKMVIERGEAKEKLLRALTHAVPVLDNDEEDSK